MSAPPSEDTAVLYKKVDEDVPVSAPSMPQVEQYQPPPYQPGTAAIGAATPYPYSQPQDNVTVIVQQPSVPPTTVEPVNAEYSNIANTALICAVISTVIILITGCWWTLPCNAIGLTLGITALQAKTENVKSQAGVSIFCSLFGLFTGVTGAAIILASILSAVFSASQVN